MVERGIGSGGLGARNHTAPRSSLKRLTFFAIFIDQKAAGHVDYSFQTHPQPAPSLPLSESCATVVNGSLTAFPQRQSSENTSHFIRL